VNGLSESSHIGKQTYRTKCGSFHLLAEIANPFDE